ELVLVELHDAVDRQVLILAACRTRVVSAGACQHAALPIDGYLRRIDNDVIEFADDTGRSWSGHLFGQDRTGDVGDVAGYHMGPTFACALEHALLGIVEALA